MGGPLGNPTFPQDCAPRESLNSLRTSQGKKIPDYPATFPLFVPDNTSCKTGDRELLGLGEIGIPTHYRKSYRFPSIPRLSQLEVPMRTSSQDSQDFPDVTLSLGSPERQSQWLGHLVVNCAGYTTKQLQLQLQSRMAWSKIPVPSYLFAPVQ